MRNPWGLVEYTGKWGPKSDEINHRENINKIMKLQTTIDEDNKWTQFKDDGTFLMD